MQKAIIFILIIASPLLACAQPESKTLHYFNITQAGILMGQNQQALSIQTINGIACKKYKAGIGIALDKYGYKSVPVFADLRYNLLKRALQVYADAGINMPVYTNQLPAKLPNGYQWHTMHKSFYGEAGLSYSVAIKHTFSLIAGAGYNYKTFAYTETTYTGDLTLQETDTDYFYRYSKWVLRLGIGF